MAVVKGLKVGDCFEDGGLRYCVKKVNADGSYVSVRVEKEPEKKAAPKRTSKKAE